MNDHILIAEDHEDIFENLKRKISKKYPKVKVEIADTCDKAYRLIKGNLKINPFTILVLDLTFKSQHTNAELKHGRHLLSKLKIENINIPTIIYSSHNNMEHIYPTIKNYNPSGYIVKSNTSSNEVIFAVEQVQKGKTYFSPEVHNLQMKRLKYSFDLDEIDEQIIKFLPKSNTIVCWEGKVLKSNIPLSYKSIKKRIDFLCDKFEVDNEKQLLLKLQKLAIL